MDSPFTRRNSLDENFNNNNNDNDRIINSSIEYMRLLVNVSNQHENNNRQYISLLDRIVTMGFHTHLNTLRYRNNPNTESPQNNRRSYAENVPVSSMGSQSTVDSMNEPIESINLVTPITSPIPPRRQSRRTVLNPNTGRQYNMFGNTRRRTTEETPILPNPFYNLFSQTFEDVINRPTEDQISNSSTIILYDFNTWTYNSRTCPIGLTDFEDGDEIRILNVCGHYFNKNNIDRWFTSNINCPLCRHDIREYNVTPRDISGDEVNIIRDISGDEVNIIRDISGDRVTTSTDELNDINTEEQNNILNRLTNQLHHLNTNDSINLTSLSILFNLDRDTDISNNNF